MVQSAKQLGTERGARCYYNIRHKQPDVTGKFDCRVPDSQGRESSALWIQANPGQEAGWRIWLGAHEDPTTEFRTAQERPRWRPTPPRPAGAGRGKRNRRKFR